MNMNKLKNNRKPGFRLALFACVVAVMVVAMGAFTRLVDAGLGCPDWPTCYGHALWPGTAEEVTAANQAYPHAPVEHDKTWPEMVHRYFAQSLGFIVIGLYIVALRQDKQGQPKALINSLLFLNIAMTVATIIYGVVIEPYAVASVAISMLALGYLALVRGSSQQPYKLPAFILAFIILQGLFGMWTVTLKLWPQVVTSHLLGGFTTLGLLWLLTLRYHNQRWSLPANTVTKLESLRPWVALGLIIVVAQVALGGWTTSNYPAVACPDLPTCQGEWLPAMNFSQGFTVSQAIGPNYLGGLLTNEARVAIHFAHRIGAMVTAAYLLFLVYALFVRVAVKETRRMAIVVLLVLGLQIGLGLANVIFNFPVAVAVAHNLVGALLVLTLITLNYKVFTSTAGNRNSI